MPLLEHRYAEYVSTQVYDFSMNILYTNLSLNERIKQNPSQTKWTVSDTADLRCHSCSESWLQTSKRHTAQCYLSTWTLHPEWVPAL